MNGEASEACAVGLGVACQRVPAGRQVRSVVAADRGDGVGVEVLWPSGSRLGDGNTLQVPQSWGRVSHIDSESTEPRDAGFKSMRFAGRSPQDRAGVC